MVANQINSNGALVAAWELLAGGDYFKIFDWRLGYALIGTFDPPSSIPQQVSSTIADADSPQVKRRYWQGYIAI